MLNSSNEDKSEKIQENMLLPRTTNLMVEWFRQISDQFWPIQSFQFCKSVFHFQKLCIFGLLYFWLLIKYYIPYFINSNYRTARSYIGPHREVQYWNIGPRASHSALYFNIEPLGSVQYSFFSSCPIITQFIDLVLNWNICCAGRSFHGALCGNWNKNGLFRLWKSGIKGNKECN